MAPARSTSLASKPVTVSEKVNVAVKSSAAVIQSDIPPIVTVGASASHPVAAISARTGPVFTPSVAASCLTVTTKAESMCGVTTSV